MMINTVKILITHTLFPGRVMGGTWAVQGLSTCGLSLGQRRVTTVCFCFYIGSLLSVFIMRNNGSFELGHDQVG